MSPAKSKTPFIDTQKLRIVLWKALAFNSRPTEETFPELPTVLVWIRCIIAIVYGTLLGMRSVRGGLMILNAVNILSFLPVMYCRFYLGTGVDEFRMSILFSGIMPAIALTLLIWIYFYTLHHELEAEKLSIMLLQSPIRGSDEETVQDVLEEASPISDVGDTEF